MFDYLQALWGLKDEKSVSVAWRSESTGETRFCMVTIRVTQHCFEIETVTTFLAYWNRVCVCSRGPTSDVTFSSHRLFSCTLFFSSCPPSGIKSRLENKTQLRESWKRHLLTE